jgi:serine/threonine protein kinase
VNRYEVGQPFFTSGRSTFYRGTNRLLGSEVVVRRLDVDPSREADQRATFYREQRHMASLRHPHIQKTLDVFEEDGALWSVHPYVPIRPTDEIVEEKGPFAVADAARMAAHVADALSYLHERGFVHGRVTPEFVLWADRGDTILTNLVKSADLAAGIWPLREAVLGLGTFSAPEERCGEKPTDASDLFGLCATFLYWVNGSVKEVEALVHVYCESGDASEETALLASRVPQLPRVLQDAIASALQPDPRRRRGSAAALAALFTELHSRQAAEVPIGFETGTIVRANGVEEPIELTGRVGAGKFGVVLRARTSSAGNRLAVKVLKPEHRDDALVVERFLREARALTKIRHENVVRVLGVGESRDVPFLVMDFVDGPALATHLRKNGMLGARESAALAVGIARGLGAIHEASLLHRDLKPDNVMLSGARPVITDLGVAKALKEEALTMSGALVGTPLYMAPEQASNHEVSQATDLYALGAILYECLGGSPPHREPDLLTLLYAVRSRPPAPLPETVPAPLSDLVFRLLRKDPSQRPQHAAEVAGELEGLLATLSG